MRDVQKTAAQLTGKNDSNRLLLCGLCNEVDVSVSTSGLHRRSAVDGGVQKKSQPWPSEWEWTVTLTSQFLPA